MQIEVHRDTIPFHRNSAPDMAWRYTDSHGHEHRWHGTVERASTPTIRWVYDDGMPDDYEPPEDRDDYVPPRPGHYECVQCGDIVPEPQTTFHTYHLAGETHFFLDGHYITRETAHWVFAHKQYPPDWPHPQE